MPAWTFKKAQHQTGQLGPGSEDKTLPAYLSEKGLSRDDVERGKLVGGPPVSDLLEGGGWGSTGVKKTKILLIQKQKNIRLLQGPKGRIIHRRNLDVSSPLETSQRTPICLLQMGSVETELQGPVDKKPFLYLSSEKQHVGSWMCRSSRCRVLPRKGLYPQYTQS